MSVDLCVLVMGGRGVFWSAALLRELSNLKSNERSGEASHLQHFEYTVEEQGGIEYELCPRCWQTRGNRANLLSTLLNYWR